MPADRTRAERVGALDRPPRGDVGLIVLGVTAVSTSAPLIRLAMAPTLALAFWRNALASLVLVPYALVRNGPELRGLSRAEVRLATYAGLLLAAHFATWIPSLSFTSVASSVALVAVQPVWAALIARARGEHVPSRAFAGIGLAVAGATLLTGIDLSISGRALFGDLLALVGGALAAAYVTVGAEARRTLTTTAYTAICYPVAAVGLLVVALLARTDLVGLDARGWWCVVGLTVGAQLLGHSVFNRVLRTTSPTVVSIAILFEIVGAALIAAFPPIRETPPLAAIPAAALIAAGVVVVVKAGERRPEIAAAPVME
jgi:drug/metabolite transporter (DMT)-like permease